LYEGIKVISNKKWDTIYVESIYDASAEKMRHWIKILMGWRELVGVWIRVGTNLGQVIVHSSLIKKQ